MGLSAAQRVVAASLQGVAARHANGQQATNATHDPVGSPCGDDAAVAELHAHTTDPDLLTVAAAMLVGSGHWYTDEALRLLALAGADLDAARVYREEHSPAVFRPPQAGRSGPG